MPLTDSLRDDILASVPSLRAFAISLSGNGDRADDLAVHLFRPRRINIVGTEAGFDVSHRNLVVEGSQSAGERRGRVALHDDPIGLKSVEDLSDPG